VERRRLTGLPRRHQAASGGWPHRGDTDQEPRLNTASRLRGQTEQWILLNGCQEIISVLSGLDRSHIPAPPAGARYRYMLAHCLDDGRESSKIHISARDS